MVLLSDIAENPKNYLQQKSLVTALRSQNSLANFIDLSFEIIGSSLNTQKKISENVLDGGYEQLDKQRKSALFALQRIEEKNKKPDKASRLGLLNEVKLLKSEIQTLRNDLLLMTLAFDKSLLQGARYARQSSPSVQELCKKEQRELLDILTLRKVTFNSNVIKLSDE